MRKGGVAGLYSSSIVMWNEMHSHAVSASQTKAALRVPCIPNNVKKQIMQFFAAPALSRGVGDINTYTYVHTHTHTRTQQVRLQSTHPADSWCMTHSGHNVHMGTWANGRGQQPGNCWIDEHTKRWPYVRASNKYHKLLAQRIWVEVEEGKGKRNAGCWVSE